MRGRWSTQLPTRSESRFGAQTAAVRETDLGRVRLEQEDRDQRQRELGDAVAELGERLADPEPAKARVSCQREPPPLTASRPGGRRRLPA